MDFRIELRIAAHQYFQAHGTGDVGCFCQSPGVMNRQGLEPGHDLGAVNQGQTFARLQGDRFQAGLF